MEATAIGLVISAFVPKILELLKSKRWAPFIQPYAPMLNRCTGAVVALLTTVGVTIDFDAVAGVLTVGGLLPDQILLTGITWLMNWGVQELVYYAFINRPSAVPPTGRRGGLYLVPILLAVGLAAGCAGKSKAIAVQADATIYTILSSVQTGADQLQASGVITADERRALSPALLKALKLGRSFNEAVSASTPLEAIAPLLDAIRELQEVIRKIVPASAQGALLSNLDRAAGLLPAGGQ
jgi:hypothetical protein